MKENAIFSTSYRNRCFDERLRLLPANQNPNQNLKFKIRVKSQPCLILSPKLYVYIVEYKRDSIIAK